MLSTTENKMTYIVGTSAVFPFSIRFFDSENIRCYLEKETGVSEELAAGTDFAVEIKDSYEAGANITLLRCPLPAGKRLTIIRMIPLTQDINLPNSGKLPTSSLENQLDKIVMQHQQMKEAIERTVKTDIISDMTADDLLLSIKNSEKSANAAKLGAETAKTETVAIKQEAEAAKFGAETAAERVENVIGKSIFDVFYSMSSQTPPGAMSLALGTTIANCDTAFPDFWVECIGRKNAGTIRTLTNAEYEAELIANDGNCGAFVVDETAKSVRLPKITGYLRSGTNDQLGTYLGDAIRNLTGQFNGVTASTILGIYQAGNTGGGLGGTGSGSIQTYISNASLQVPTADENRPKTVYGCLYIQVYNSAISASVAQAANFINLLEAKADLANVPTLAKNRVWVSDPQAILLNTLYQVTHNLNLVNADLVTVRSCGVLICTTATSGYQVGDYVFGWDPYISSANNYPTSPVVSTNSLQFRLDQIGVKILTGTGRLTAAQVTANFNLLFVIFY